MVADMPEDKLAGLMREELWLGPNARTTPRAVGIGQASSS